MANNFEGNQRRGPNSGPNRILGVSEQELKDLREQNRRLKEVARVSGKEKRKLRELSETDEMTNLLNKRGLEKRLYELFSQLIAGESERRKESLSKIALAVIDMDGLKSINDNYGHSVGDRAIIALGRHLKAKLRSTDILGRCGEKADEFILIISNMEEGHLEKRLVEIEKSLEGIIIADEKGSPVKISASLGFTMIDKESAQEMSIEEAKRLADQNMYRQKVRRKNGMA
ncbi:MAG: GGDEF domain-containing protein [Patescibacteria group bacterium]